MATTAVVQKKGPSSSRDALSPILEESRTCYQKAKRHIKEALRLDEGGLKKQALDEYSKGLQLLSSALSALGKKQLQDQAVVELQEKISGTKAQVKERMHSLLDLLSSEPQQSNPGAGTRTVLSTAGASTVTKGTVGTATSQSRPLLPATTAKEEARTSDTAQVVLRVSRGVGLFRVNKAGHVVKFEDVDSFHVFRLLNPPEGKPTAFVQCGQWVYPLAAGKSPVLKSAPTTYMFPELGRDESCSVGIVLDGASAEELQFLDTFLQSHSLLRTSEGNGEVAPSNSKMADALEDPTWGGSLAKGIVTGTSYVNKGLTVGADYAGRMISYGADKVRDQLRPVEKETEVTPEVKAAVTGAREITGELVQISHSLMHNLAVLTLKAGRKVQDIASTSEVVQSYQANPHLQEAWKVTKAGAAGAGEVFSMLDHNGRALVDKLSNEASHTAAHRFGRQVGEVTQEGLSTAVHVADLALTYCTWKTLGIKFVGELGKAASEETKTAGR